MLKFSTLLIEERKKKNLLMKDVAKLFEWTPMYYSRYEHGDLLPNEHNIEKFAKFIGIDKKDLKDIIDKERHELDRN